MEFITSFFTSTPTAFFLVPLLVVLVALLVVINSSRKNDVCQTLPPVEGSVPPVATTPVKAEPSEVVVQEIITPQPHVEEAVQSSAPVTPAPAPASAPAVTEPVAPVVPVDAVSPSAQSVPEVVTPNPVIVQTNEHAQSPVIAPEGTQVEPQVTESVDPVVQATEAPQSIPSWRPVEAVIAPVSEEVPQASVSEVAPAQPETTEVKPAQTVGTAPTSQM